MSQVPINYKMKRLIFSFAFSFLLLSLFGQENGSLKGRVSNAETKEYIRDANISIRGENVGTSSGEEGYFEITDLSPGKYHLIISVVGYNKKNVTVQLPQSTGEGFQIELIPEIKELGDVKIVAQHFHILSDSSIEREPVSLTATISSISAAEIEKQGAVTLIDAMQYIPGAWTQTRGRKVKQFFSVRGQKYPYPEYSIDGIWQKEFEETGYLMSTLNIESIEIVRSSSALVKGLSGLTGIIDVKTKKPNRKSTSAEIKYGSLNTFLVNANHGNKVKDIRYSVSASFFGTNGPSGRNGKERIANMNGQFDWQINKKLLLSSNTMLIYGMRELVQAVAPASAKFAGMEEKYDPIQTLVSSVKLNYKSSDKSITELQANIAYRNPEYSVYFISEDNHNNYNEKDYEYSLNLLHSHHLSSNNVLRVGGLYNHWVAPEGKRFYYGNKADVHTWSAVIADEQKVGRFIFDAGIRLIGDYIDEWGAFGIEGAASKFSNVQPIQNEVAPLVMQTIMGASFIFSEFSSIHGHFAGGNIAPRKGSLTEELITPENEMRFQYDLGFKKRSAVGDEITLGLFFVDRNNAIDYSGITIEDEDGNLMELYENRDKRNFGIEVDARKRLSVLNLSLFANFTFMESVILEDGINEKDTETPKIITNAGIMYDNNPFDINLFAHYTGPYENDRFVDKTWLAENGKAPLGDFFTLNLTSGYTLGKSKYTRIYIEIRNITNVKYQTVAGYPDNGRMLFFGIKLNF